MNISRSECLERFFSFVQVGDMVEGHIECKVGLLERECSVSLCRN